MPRRSKRAARTGEVRLTSAVSPAPPPASTPRAPTAASFVLGAATAVVALWFLHEVALAVSLLFLAAVVAIALSAPVRWFVSHGVPRKWAAALTLVLFFGAVVAIGVLVIPRVAEQLVTLANNLPALVGQIDRQIAHLLSNYPDLQRSARFDGVSGALLPSAPRVVAGVAAFSLSLLGVVALLVIFFSIILYTVIDPVPILRTYLRSLPIASRPAGVRAYRRAAHAVIGWAKASLLIGSIQFVLVFGFLTWMHIPAALVWAALAFFAELVPRIGGYIMALPPVLVALTHGPLAALWVALFYLVMNELLGDLVAPRIRGVTMKLHPVLLIFFTLAFALAFGLVGAIVATPAAAFASAFYSEFWVKRAAVTAPSRSTSPRR